MPQIDPLQKPAVLTVGKKTFQLDFNLDAIAQAEELTGMPLLFGIDWSNIGVSRLLGILQAALRTHQPEMTAAQIKRLVQPRYVKAIEAALVEAWFQAMPDPDEEAAENPPLPTA